MGPLLPSWAMTGFPLLMCVGVLSEGLCGLDGLIAWLASGTVIMLGTAPFRCQYFVRLTGMHSQRGQLISSVLVLSWRCCHLVWISYFWRLGHGWRGVLFFSYTWQRGFSQRVDPVCEVIEGFS